MTVQKGWCSVGGGFGKRCLEQLRRWRCGRRCPMTRKKERQRVQHTQCSHPTGQDSHRSLSSVAQQPSETGRRLGTGGAKLTPAAPKHHRARRHLCSLAREKTPNVNEVQDQRGKSAVLHVVCTEPTQDGAALLGFLETSDKKHGCDCIWTRKDESWGWAHQRHCPEELTNLWEPRLGTDLQRGSCGAAASDTEQLSPSFYRPLSSSPHPSSNQT